MRIKLIFQFDLIFRASEVGVRPTNNRLYWRSFFINGMNHVHRHYSNGIIFAKLDTVGSNAAAIIIVANFTKSEKNLCSRVKRSIHSRARIFLAYFVLTATITVHNTSFRTDKLRAGGALRRLAVINVTRAAKVSGELFFPFTRAEMYEHGDSTYLCARFFF